MGHENENNRSTALTPELLATINAATSAAVKEAVSGIFSNLAPLLKDMAVTPEKLREGMRPYVDPDKERREIREKMKFRQDEEDKERQDRARQDNCLHRDQNGRSSIQVVHNFFDRQPRGICALCGDWIHPKEWRIGKPTEEHPRGAPYCVEPHKNYQTVRELDSRN
jgi:hypothetical protein